MHCRPRGCASRPRISSRCSSSPTSARRPRSTSAWTSKASHCRPRRPRQSPRNSRRLARPYSRSRLNIFRFNYI
jgi:hypothetical protein